jgi:hypothetical protein
MVTSYSFNGTLRAKFHACTGPGPFFEVNGWASEKGVVPCAHLLSPKDWYPPWMGVPLFVLCKNGCQRIGGTNGNEKDKCRLESYGDRNGRSLRLRPWVLKATLFFKSFLLGRTLGVHCGTVVLFWEGQGTHLALE